jgi:hypothetical protein
LGKKTKDDTNLLMSSFVTVLVFFLQHNFVAIGITLLQNLGYHVSIEPKVLCLPHEHPGDLSELHIQFSLIIFLSSSNLLWH